MRAPRSSASAPLLAGMILAVAAALPGTARADEVDRANELFEQAKARFEAGQIESACAAFAESQRLDPRPGRLFSLATCEVRLGKIASAVAHFNAYLALHDKMSPEAQKQQEARAAIARAQRDRLTPAIPRLSLWLPPGAPAGLVVTRDGVAVPPSALGEDQLVDPGEHVVTTKTPLGDVRIQHVTLERGESKKVLLLGVLQPVPEGETAPPEPPPAASTGPSGQRIAAYTFGGLGALGLVAGGITGALAMDRSKRIAAHCGAAIGSADSLACDRTGLDAANEAKLFGTASTVGFVLGGAALGSALVTFVLEPKAGGAPPAASSLRQNTPPRTVTFSAGVSVGPGGAFAGLQGAW